MVRVIKTHCFLPGGNCSSDIIHEVTVSPVK